MYPSPSFFFVAVLAFSHAVRSDEEEKRAIVPTASGQIGINPWKTGLGPAQSWEGINTKYQSAWMLPNHTPTTEWIFKHADYLTDVVVTSTITTGPKTTTTILSTSVPIAVSTAPANAPGVTAGEVSVTFSPDLVAKLKAIADQVCGTHGKLRRRSGAQSCAYDYANRVAGTGGPMEFDIPLPTITAADIADVVGAVGGLVRSRYGAVGFALLGLYAYQNGGVWPNTVKAPKKDLQIPPNQPSNQPSVSPTSSSICPSGSNSPVCQRKDLCNSPNNATCTNGIDEVKYAKCTCSNYVDITYDPYKFGDPTLLNVQQNILSTFASLEVSFNNMPTTTTSMSKPTCMADGSPVYEPPSWCDCGPSAKYPTLPFPSGQSSSPETTAYCGYTVLPSKTINPTSKKGTSLPTNIPGKYGVSGCAYYAATEQGYPPGTPNYCFCGGGPHAPPALAPLLTHSNVKPPSTDCNYPTQPTPGWKPPVPHQSSKASPPPSKPTALGSRVCKPYKNSYSNCWNDIHTGSVEACDSAMQNQIGYSGCTMTSHSSNITQVYREGAGYSGTGGNGVTYMMNIGWIPGCTQFSSQVCDNPLGKSGDNTISFHTIIKNTYYYCTQNNGLGGYQDVGCLRYGFYPNDINGVFNSPPQPELYWQANGNICG